MLLASFGASAPKKGDLRPARAEAKRNPFASRWHVGAFWPVVPASDDAVRPLAAINIHILHSRIAYFSCSRDCEPPKVNLQGCNTCGQVTVLYALI